MLKTMKNLEWFFEKEYNSNKKLLEMLKHPKKWNITFTDFDDTLVSRQPQFYSDKRFLENRWEKWVQFVKKVIWLKNFFEKYYNQNLVIKDILNKTDIILTAWEEDIQKWKLDYTKINKKYLIVKKHNQKAEYILKYILENFENIPETITFIDDKAFILEKEIQELSKILQTKIILQNIEIDKIDYTKKYKITEKIFDNGKEFIFSNWLKYRIFDENEKEEI